MSYFCISDIGLKREINQDSYCAIKNENGDLLSLVCDGIGGGKAGDVASGEAIKFFINSFSIIDHFKDAKEAKQYLIETVEKCNSEIYQLSLKYKEYLGMGTTITGVLITDVGTFTINIGDSRVYGYLNNEEFRLTNDHTLVNDMVKNGEITYEESLTHPKRHYLTKALGVWEISEVDIDLINNHDFYLICSDGLYNYIDAEELKSIMIDSVLNCEDKCNKLLEKALLNGGYDNITIIVINCLDE